MGRNPNLSYIPPQLRKTDKKKGKGNKFSLPEPEGRATQKAIAERRRRRSSRKKRRKSTRNRSRSRGWSKHERQRDFHDFRRYKRRRSRGRARGRSAQINRHRMPPWARAPRRNNSGKTVCIVLSSILGLAFLFVATIYIIDWLKGGDGTNAFAVIGWGSEEPRATLPPIPKPRGTTNTLDDLSANCSIVERYKWWIFGGLGVVALWWFESLPFYHWNPVTTLFGDPDEDTSKKKGSGTGTSRARCKDRKCKWDQYEKCRTRYAPKAERPSTKPSVWDDNSQGKLTKDYGKFAKKVDPNAGGTSEAQKCINQVYSGGYADEFKK